MIPYYSKKCVLGAATGGRSSPCPTAGGGIVRVENRMTLTKSAKHLMSLRKNEQSNFIAELTFKGKVKGKVEMLRDVVQSELGNIKRSGQEGLIRKGFLEEGALRMHWRRRKTGISK